jgi:hypothetical protein
MQRKCANSAGNFFYICGEVTFSSQKLAIIPITRKPYHLYFGCQVGDQDKNWDPHLRCNMCTTSLRSWLSHRRRSVSFAIPVIWREQTDNISDSLLHGPSPSARFFQEERMDLMLSEYTICYAASTSRRRTYRSRTSRRSYTGIGK